VATTILLARHGETDWNAERRWQGHVDRPLNELGREQAHGLADALEGESIAAIYSSDLLRAHETARIVGARLGIDVVVDPALREMDVGSWSGLTNDEIQDRFPEQFERWSPGEHPPHDGETRDELRARVLAAVERIAIAHRDARVLIVAHGGVLRAVLRSISDAHRLRRFANCDVARIAVEDGRVTALD